VYFTSAFHDQSEQCLNNLRGFSVMARRQCAIQFRIPYGGRFIAHGEITVKPTDGQFDCRRDDNPKPVEFDQLPGHIRELANAVCDQPVAQLRVFPKSIQMKVPVGLSDDGLLELKLAADVAFRQGRVRGKVGYPLPNLVTTIV
jgi:hypothetical protein